MCFVCHLSPTTAGALNFSGTAEANSNFTGFDDDGNIASTVGKLQHSRKASLVFQYVDVLERNFATGISLPGARGVGSEIFAKDKNFFVHFLLNVKNRRAPVKLQVNRALCYFQQNFICFERGPICVDPRRHCPDQPETWRSPG
jgi:hypothetical protein